jgi:tagatose 1,6-diphosphate aldolase
MKITPGKVKGLNAVSNSRGVIAAAAMDQRGSLRSAIAKDKGVDKSAVTAGMMSEFKEAVVRILTPYASAILLDPEFGLTAAKSRAKGCGLLLAYEKTGYDTNQPGRLPDLLDDYSVRSWSARPPAQRPVGRPVPEGTCNQRGKPGRSLVHAPAREPR